MRELLSFKRVAFRPKIEYIYCGRSYPGYLENLSLSGALVELDEAVQVPLGHSCILCIHLDAEDETSLPLKLCCETIHGSSALLGMRFLACDDATRQQLLLQMERMEEPGSIPDGLDRIRGYIIDYQSTL